MDKDLFHRLEGESICFKPLSINDAKDIHEYASDTDVSRFIGWPLMDTVSDTRKHIEEMLEREAAGTHLYATVILKSTNEVIGTALVFNFEWQDKHAEIGYVFHKRHWGRGYCTQTVALMSDFAFESLKLHRIHARVAHANIGSVRVLEKNGFKLEGRLRDYYFVDDLYYDGLYFGKLQSD